jgi:hypothetical protein
MSIWPIVNYRAEWPTLEFRINGTMHNPRQKLTDDQKKAKAKARAIAKASRKRNRE